MTMVLIIAAALVVLALAVKPLRKTMGLLTAILGVIACLTGVGIVIGIPMVFVGGILLFV
ncbi:MAG: hypothetical protein ACOX6A_03955 [Atribacter sp.]|uniref:hypothetical protein n=1 Tax=Atribacter sp. TaxID=2847780 RepID=UPI003D98C255